MANDYSPKPSSEEFMKQFLGNKKPKTDEERIKEMEEAMRAPDHKESA